MTDAHDNSPEARLEDLLAAGWRPGRFGPLTPRLYSPTKQRAQLARAVAALRAGRQVTQGVAE